MTRPLYKIADEIKTVWKNPFFGAKPYLNAMQLLTGMDDSYGMDSAKSIVIYFLSNAQTWRGPDARRIKKELKGML